MTDETRKLWAWMAAATVPNRTDIRIDCDGRIIRWSEYGSRSAYGWEIDHIRPSAIGGSDSVLNLRARHWMGNSRAGGLLASLLNPLGKAG